MIVELLFFVLFVLFWILLEFGYVEESSEVTILKHLDIKISGKWWSPFVIVSLLRSDIIGMKEM